MIFDLLCFFGFVASIPTVLPVTSEYSSVISLDRSFAIPMGKGDNVPG
jgi:hypothetical protein